MNKYRVWPTATFISVIAAGVIARLIIGRIYSARKAVDLLDSLNEGGLFLGSAAATAAATILALMLTLVGLVHRSDTSFGRNIYGDILKVARNATVALLTSLLLLLILTMPTTDFENMPPEWYTWLYEAMFIAVVATIATMATTVVRLYLTIKCVIMEWSDSGDGDD